MKICCTCKTGKENTEFGINRKKSDGLSSRCLECSRISASKWYHANRGIHKHRVKINIKAVKEWYYALKRDMKCSVCGESHPACIEFHHRDPKKKDMAVSRMFMSGSRRKILEEIEKCDILCANCHRKVHYPNGRMM